VETRRALFEVRTEFVSKGLINISAIEHDRADPGESLVILEAERLRLLQLSWSAGQLDESSVYHSQRGNGQDDKRKRQEAKKAGTKVNRHSERELVQNGFKANKRPWNCCTFVLFPRMRSCQQVSSPS
jgi:hypothetical protein